MYFIELLATKQCNQNCYYCTTKSNDSVEVDIDYLKWVLDQCPNNLGVELTGGEIGLLTNIDEFYRTAKRHSHVKYIRALSNGRLRQLGVDWLDEVDYWEHLIQDIVGRDILKFYPLDLDSDHTYVTVTTETTTKSLLENWDYYKQMGIFRHNFFYKLMNHKSNELIDNYLEDLSELYRKLDNRYFKRMIITHTLKSFLKLERDMCQKYSPNPFVDLQTRELGHCAININESTRVKFSKRNLKKLMNGKLSENDYCQRCHSFDDGRERSLTNNRSYKR